MPLERERFFEVYNGHPESTTPATPPGSAWMRCGCAARIPVDRIEAGVVYGWRRRLTQLSQSGSGQSNAGGLGHGAGSPSHGESIISRWRRGFLCDHRRHADGRSPHADATGVVIQPQPG